MNSNGSIPSSTLAHKHVYGTKCNRSGQKGLRFHVQTDDLQISKSSNLDAACMYEIRRKDGEEEHR